VPSKLFRRLPPVRRLAALAFLALLPAMMWAAVQPQLAPPAEHSADKFLHILAFGFMAVLGWTACSRLRSRALVLTALSGFGILIEVAQAMVPGRQGSPQDWMADNLGILAGIALAAGLEALLRLRAEAARG
jgi:VanZ family protein